MMINDVRSQAEVEAAQVDSSSSSASSSASSQPSTFSYTYHEISEQHVVEADVLEQLKANMAQLEDLHHRLKFMMGEIGSLLRKV